MDFSLLFPSHLIKKKTSQFNHINPNNDSLYFRADLHAFIIIIQLIKMPASIFN